MTVVEFFDGVSINNMASCLAIKPEKVIFIGKKEMLESQKEQYLRFVNKYGLKVEFEFRAVEIYNIKNLIETLSTIVNNEDDCTFDLTGGDETTLVAMGIVYERYRNVKKVQMHYFNVSKGESNDFDNDGITPPSTMPKITVEDNVMLYGGCIVPYDGNKGTYKWNIDDEFKADVKNMWEFCKKNPTLWNAATGIVAEAIANAETKDGEEPYAEFDFKKLEVRFENNEELKEYFEEFLNHLQKHRLVKLFKATSNTKAFCFKNSRVRRCLAKAGNVFELTVFLHAQNATDENGNKRYNDIVLGAYIDWDSQLHERKSPIKDTENEVDVILMEGMVPVFVSCKNGKVEEEEIYKLQTVAQRFGGPYAKKVIVFTAGGSMSKSSCACLNQRAKDMGVKIIEGAHELSDEEFERRISNVTC